MSLAWLMPRGRDLEMNAITMNHKDDSYAGLLQQIRNDLRLQHPEWIQANGQCPLCDCYEARLIKLLGASMPGETGEKSIAATFSQSAGSHRKESGLTIMAEDAA